MRWSRAWPYGAGLGLAAVLVLPFVIRQNSWAEWGNAYYLLFDQTEQVRDAGVPTFVLSSQPSGVAYPIHVFYGGFTITILSYVAALTSVWFAFTASIFAAFFCAYLGPYWAARALSSSRTTAVLIASIAMTTPYFVTNLYGRGSWAELVGVSASYLLLGAVLRTLREIADGSYRVSTWIALVAAAAVLAGTHNISLLLGVPLVVLVGGAAMFAFPELWPRGRWRAAATRLVLPGGLGAALTAPWLVPNLLYGGRTQVSSWSISNTSEPFDSLAIIFSPVLKFPEAQQRIIEQAYGGPVDVRLFNQTCALVLVPMALALAAHVGRRPGRPPRISRVLVGGLILAVAALGCVLLMTQTAWWDGFPETLRAVQFPYRINSYLSILLVLMLALAFVGLTRSRRTTIARIMLVVVAVWYLGMAVFQTLTAEPLAPPGFEAADHGKIDGGSLPPIFVDGTAPPIQFRMPSYGTVLAAPATALAFDEAGVLTGDPPAVPGPHATNIVWSPFVRVEGASILGHDGAGLAVIVLDGDSGVVPHVASTRPRPATLGLAIGALATLVLVALAIAAVMQRMRARRAEVPAAPAGIELADAARSPAASQPVL